MIVFPEEKCVQAIESFASKHLTNLFNESFDQSLKEKTCKALELATNFNYEAGRIRSSSIKEREMMNSLIAEYTHICDKLYVLMPFLGLRMLLSHTD